MEETKYGIKLAPSKRAVDAFPNDESSSIPEIINIRSDSMMLLPVCVSCRGTIASCEIMVSFWSVEADGNHKNDYSLEFKSSIPNVVQF